MTNKQHLKTDVVKCASMFVDWQSIIQTSTKQHSYSRPNDNQQSQSPTYEHEQSQKIQENIYENQQSQNLQNPKQALRLRL